MRSRIRRSVFQSWWRTYQRSSSIRSAHGQGRAAVDLRPAGDPRLHVEPVQLPLVVLLDLVAERRARPDHRHVAADDVPELRQLVEAQPPQEPSRPRDPRVALGRPRSPRPASRRRRPSCAASAARSRRRPCRRGSGGRAPGRRPAASPPRRQTARNGLETTSPVPAIATSSARFKRACPPRPPRSPARRGAGS